MFHARDAHIFRSISLLDHFPNEINYRVAMGGLLPFAVIFIELFYLLKSIWEGQYYYMFGFLSLVFAILLVTCIQVSIVVVYFQLCSEVILTCLGYKREAG
jgi:hypothetical protein